MIQLPYTGSRYTSYVLDNQVRYQILQSCPRYPKQVTDTLVIKIHHASFASKSQNITTTSHFAFHFLRLFHLHIQKRKEDIAKMRRMKTFRFFFYSSPNHINLDAEEKLSSFFTFK